MARTPWELWNENSFTPEEEIGSRAFEVFICHSDVTGLGFWTEIRLECHA